MSLNYIVRLYSWLTFHDCVNLNRLIHLTKIVCVLLLVVATVVGWTYIGEVALSLLHCWYQQWEVALGNFCLYIVVHGLKTLVYKIFAKVGAELISSGLHRAKVLNLNHRSLP